MAHLHQCLILSSLLLGVYSSGTLPTFPRHGRLYSKFIQSPQPLRLKGGFAVTPASPLPISEKSTAKAAIDGKVTLVFSIGYGLDNGVMVVSGPSDILGRGDANRAPKMQRKGGEQWELTLEVPLDKDVLVYNYIAMSNTHRYEARICERSISLSGLKPGTKVHLQDSFRSPKVATLATSCFAKAIFGRGNAEQYTKTENKVVSPSEIMWDAVADDEASVRFVVFAPRLEAGHSVWVSGSVEALGKWSTSSYLPMAHVGSHVYVGQVKVKKSELPVEFKYVVLDSNGQVVCKEKGDNRKVASNSDTRFVVSDSTFNYPTAVYRSAGVAIPVSGIKTSDSMGIGEFLDLMKVVDWCKLTGLQLIQVLPINDSGEDPSPYSASSSFALHPSYIRPAAVCEYYNKRFGVDASGCENWAKGLVDQLNKNWRIDHPKVMDEKRKLMDAIFDKVGIDVIMKDPELQKWAEASSSWLKTYAAFKVQLAKERTFNNKWWDCTTWRVHADEADSMTREQSLDYPTVARVYFIQYHLHHQLKEASRYAELNGIALKGDIPIGVTRCSSDVWAEPNLFKLDRNAGAPGYPEQNWGFPPYNWDEMHRDGCKWWRRRLQHMEQYFHAYRIDHVLGFFRMWEIPKHGGGGQYVPQGGLREWGLKNLRAIQTASNMMICGEDLGNVPPEVPPVLLELGVLGLRIQRWCDGHTWKYDYLSVAASSCHDCSPCRLWWNEEWGSVEGWYNFFIGKGECPGGPPDWVSQHIIKLHAESTSMWTINPIQDYIDMWENLRSQNCKNDIINRPGQTENCWVYRCHLRMEKLLEANDFNNFLKKMLQGAGRGTVY